MPYFWREAPTTRSRTFSQYVFFGVLGLVLLNLAACSAGREFNRPPPGSLQLNGTTKQDAFSRFGEPYNTGSQIMNDHHIDNLIYSYATNDDAHVEDVTPARSLQLFFDDDVLVGHLFDSSFKSDHTDFDETIAPRIKEGQDTCEDVKKMFGRPSGEYVYPILKEPDTNGLVYSYSHVKIGFASADMYIKRMIVTCGEDGVVKEVEFSSSGQK
jgi:hypothetical protein